jgi:CubicO group peptidase (beta-lactamase class C family)
VPPPPPPPPPPQQQQQQQQGEDGTWERCTKANILDPLGLASTGFELPAGGSLTQPRGMTRAEVASYSMGWLGPCGGMRSTVSDLARMGAEGIMASASLI